MKSANARPSRLDEVLSAGTKHDLRPYAEQILYPRGTSSAAKSARALRRLLGPKAMERIRREYFERSGQTDPHSAEMDSWIRARLERAVDSMGGRSGPVGILDAEGVGVEAKR